MVFIATTTSPPSLSLFFSSSSSRVLSSHHSNPNGGNPIILYRTSLSLPSPRLPRFSSAVAFARRKKTGSLAPKPEPSRKLQKKMPSDDEDAIEALFSQLEEDLKNDNLSGDEGDDEITEEDLARLEQELAEAFGDIDLGELPEGSTGEEGMDDEESDEEATPPTLKNWQIKRLAHALKIGRRKTSIKSLAAELGLDRAFVLELLRDPPPYLVMLCASLPDKATQTPPEPESELAAQTPAEGESEPVESLPVSTDDFAESKPEKKEAVHGMQTRWSMQKRLKKVHLETLERVYARTKRPTNSMISSIVHVTNLPFKRVVKWFEDKRLEDGIPDQRVPYRRQTTETVSTS